MSGSRLHQQLARSIRRGRILTAPAQLSGYDADGLGYKTFRPDAVVIPADIAELVQLLSDAKALDVPLTIRGAGTSLSGGPVAAQGGVVVHTSAMRQVRHISPKGFWCEVECSVVLNQLDTLLEPYGMFYPPDPSSGPVCTLGGNVAMNAGGAHCFRYGVTSNYVLGLEAVLLDGSVHRFGGPAGGRGPWREDWKRLMVGSEGTLAAFTRFWLRLLPRPQKAWTYRATFADLRSAERAIHALGQHASYPVAIEMMDPRCVAMVENSPMAVGLPKDAFLIVTEIDGPADLVDARAKTVAGLLEDAGALSVEASDDEATRKGLWKARKVAGGLMGQISPDFLVQDAVIPKRALAELLQLVYDEADAAGFPAVNVFHAGDGNLHPNFMFDSKKPGELEKVEAISKRLMERVIEVGGTLSGEHGIGNDKTSCMPLVFHEATLRMQLAVPRIFNPQHQLNPLKVFAARRFGSQTPTPPPTPPTTTTVNAHNVHTPQTFVPFFDEIDGTFCGAATLTAVDLLAMDNLRGFRFPLWLDQHANLREQLAASGFAPASSRFGPLCDNILGMNWQLPSGRIVRIGERVVKSTTGYDLMRFLLHSSGTLGSPTDVVLRLRPDCGTSGVFRLCGPHAVVTQATSALLATCWLHWFDSVDVLVSATEQTSQLRLALNCPTHEWRIVAAFVAAFAGTHSLELISQEQVPLAADGLPDFMLKTTVDRGLSLAAEIVAEFPVNCVALAYNGVVHGYLNHSTASGTSARSIASSIGTRFQAELLEVGGEWHSRHCVRPAPLDCEAEWLKVLEQEFAAV